MTSRKPVSRTHFSEKWTGQVDPTGPTTEQWLFRSERFNVLLFLWQNGPDFPHGPTFNAPLFCKMGQCSCIEPNGPNSPLLPLFLLWQNGLWLPPHGPTFSCSLMLCKMGHCACTVPNSPNPSGLWWMKEA